MPIVPCPCGARLQVPDALAGTLIRCPRCAGAVTVPPRATPGGEAIDLLPLSTVEPDQASPPPGPAPRRTVAPKPAPVPAWKLYGRWALGFALLPLVFSLFTKEDAGLRLKRMIDADPKLGVRIALLEEKRDAKEEDLFSLLPDHRIAGALVAHDSALHWGFALLSAAAFWGFLLLVYPMGNASSRGLWSVGLFTGTIGILLLLGLQRAAGWSQGMMLTGRSILVVLFYIIKFIGFSYRAALDPRNGFFLSMLGFTFGVGFCEEVCKLLPLIWHYKRTATLNLSGAVVWGLASGIGFGVSEGIMYSSNSYNGIHTGEIYVVRFVSCVALHAIWNGFSSILLWKGRAELNQIDRWYGWFVPLFKIAGVSMVLHALYDTALKQDHHAVALLTAAASFAAFFWLYERVKKDEPAFSDAAA